MLIAVLLGCYNCPIRPGLQVSPPKTHGGINYSPAHHRGSRGESKSKAGPQRNFRFLRQPGFLRWCGRDPWLSAHASGRVWLFGNASYKGILSRLPSMSQRSIQQSAFSYQPRPLTAKNTQSAKGGRWVPGSPRLARVAANGTKTVPQNNNAFSGQFQRRR